jgi:branched-chain amino acid transport system substrate-binding protein
MPRTGWKFAAAAAAMLVSTVATAAEDIKVGVFLSATGVISINGDPEKKLLETYIEKINKEGGVLGRQVKLTIYDDGSDAAKAAVFAKRLIENDNVDILIGGSGTPQSMAAIPIVEKAEIPYVSMGGGVPITEPVKKWVFKTPHTDRMVAERIFMDMKKRGITEIALLSEDVGFGKSGRDQTLLAAPKFGMKVVADEVYSPKDTDVTPQLTKIRGNSAAKALLIFGTGGGPAVATKNFRQLGFSIPIYQSHGVSSKDFLKLVGAAADGMRLPGIAMQVSEQLKDNDPQKKSAVALRKLYEDAHKSEAPIFVGVAYDAILIALEGIKKAGTTDKAKVRDAIESLKGLVGAAGTFNMSATDHLGVGAESLRMFEVKNGNFVLLD